jgi:hydrogenase maturation factor
MKAGKLPSDLLAKLLARLPADPRLLLGPGIGRDAAAIDMGDGRVLVAKSDPVTFATEEIGRYVVHVNANDIACLGARPMWFLGTALLPEGAPPELAEDIFEQIRSTCETLGIVPIGGHTEITIGLDRPIVAGTMLGETAADRLVRSDGASDGDHLLLTKAIAIEGTALLAREAPDALRAAGVANEVIASAARLLIDPGISVVREAVAACDAARIHAMHDPTEGGLATALLELSQASGLQVRVDRAALPVLPETRSVCAALGLDPLGLLASGALLIALAADDCDTVCAALRGEDISVACMGDLVSSKGDAIIDRPSQTPLPRFERDELARFFDHIDPRHT